MSRRRRRADPRPTCDACGAVVEWVTTDTGRRPLDYARSTSGRRWRIVRGYATELPGGSIGEEGRRDHRDTCTAIEHPAPPPDPRLPAGDQ